MSDLSLFTSVRLTAKATILEKTFGNSNSILILPSIRSFRSRFNKIITKNSREKYLRQRLNIFSESSKERISVKFLALNPI